LHRGAGRGPPVGHRKFHALVQHLFTSLSGLSERTHARWWRSFRVFWRKPGARRAGDMVRL